MLSGLIKRINKDDNLELKKQVFVECANMGAMQSHIEKFAFIKDTDTDFEDLKTKLESVTLCDTDTITTNMDRLVETAKADLSSLTEAVVSTAKTISMTKKDFDELSELIKVLKRESSDRTEKKNAKSKIKSFLKVCTSELRKCDDNRPADALVTAMINKLCKAFDCDVKNDKEITKKALLSLKLNALAKAISAI